MKYNSFGERLHKEMHVLQKLYILTVYTTVYKNSNETRKETTKQNM
jgi:hypothetical protein